MVLIGAHKNHDWFLAAVQKRLREELAKLKVELEVANTRLSAATEAALAASDAKFSRT